MLQFLSQPWPWWIAGPLIGLTVPLLLLLGNKSFGISSSLRHICAACLPANISFFKYDWRKESWNLVYVAGIVLGVCIAGFFFPNPADVDISQATVQALQAEGIREFRGLMPTDIFSWDSLLSIRTLVFTILGGFLIGFGTRYAGGCTSGHSIMGLSNLQWPSLIATIAFMAGGFCMTHLLLPYLIAL